MKKKETLNERIEMLELGMLFLIILIGTCGCVYLGNKIVVDVYNNLQLCK